MYVQYGFLYFDTGKAQIDRVGKKRDAWLKKGMCINREDCLDPWVRIQPLRNQTKKGWKKTIKNMLFQSNCR
jgi:hypothetical protein